MAHVVYNPYLPSWEYVPDGEPHLFEGRLYVYGSHDVAGGADFCPGDYVCWSAPEDDLTDWRYEGVIYRKTDDPANPTGEAPLYAPDVAQGPDGRYYLYYALFLAPTGRASHIGVAVCDEPAGHYRYLGDVALPTGAALDLDSGYGMVFDPAVYVEGEDVWVYWGFGMPEAKAGMPICTTEGSWVAHLAPDMLTMTAKPHRLAPAKLQAAGTSFEAHPFYEASSFRRIHGHYYFIYSSLQGHELCWAWAETPEGPLTYGGVTHSNGDVGMPDVNSPEEGRFYSGNNHGSLVEANGKVYIFGHRHTHGCQYSRQGVAEEVTVRPDGYIEQTEMTSSGLNGGPLQALRETPAYSCCHLRGPEGSCFLPVRFELSDEHPYLRQEVDADAATSSVLYVYNLRNGAEVGWKYLAFDGTERSVQLEVRGTLVGSLSVRLDAPDGPEFANVAVRPSDGWLWAESPLNTSATGTHAVYVVARGRGSLDLNALAFFSEHTL